MKNTSAYSKFGMAMLIPILIVLAIVPLVIYNDCNPLIRSATIYYNSPYDFFTAAKSGLIVVLGPVSLICAFLGTEKLSKDLRCLLKDPIFLSFGVYFILVVLSTVFSKYKDVALYGITNRNEGMFVILSYLCFWLAVVLLVRWDAQVKLIMYAIYFFVFISTIVGISQVMGKNIIISDFMLPFIMSKEHYELSAGSITVTHASLASLTFSNPNYVGSYMSMVFNVCFSLFLISENTKDRLFHGTFAVLCGFLLALSSSKGGIIAAMTGALIVVIVLHKKVQKNLKPIFVLSASLIILLAVNSYLSGTVSVKPDNASNSAEQYGESAQNNSDITNNQGEVAAKQTENRTVGRYIADFDFEGNTISAKTTEGEVFNIEYDGENIELTGNTGAPIEYELRQEDNSYYDLISPEYKGYTVYAKDDSVSIIANNSLNFIYDNGRFIMVTETNEKVYSSKPTVLPFFSGREKMLSGRAYIWGRAIPLLKNTILIGHGPDTFVFNFPHYDFEARRGVDGMYNGLVDKAHMLYLQIAITTGVVSLIAFVTAFALYYLKTIKLLLHNALCNKWFQYSVCFAGGILSYLVAGLVNDSVVSVAPTFYILFGMGYATLRNYCEETALSSGNNKNKRARKA